MRRQHATAPGSVCPFGKLDFNASPRTDCIPLLKRTEKFDLRQFIIASTFLGLFSAGSTFYVGSVHFLFFYFLILLNLLLLALMGQLWLPPGLLMLIGFLVFSGAVGIAQGTSSIGLFFKAFFGIFVSAVYYSGFLRLMRFDVEKCFAKYAQLAFYVACLGFFLMPFQNHAFAGLRMRSIEYEPGEFTIVTLPALYYFADLWQRERKYGYRVIIMLAAIALANSSIGFMGVFVGLYLLGRRFRFGAVGAPIIIFLVGFIVYVASPDFQLRLNDSLIGFQTLDASSLNASSFSLLSGAFVAAKAFLSHPIFGEGLGAIPLANARYVGALPGSDSFLEQGLLGLASGDGGSLLFRVAAEMGGLGLFLFFFFLWYCYPRSGSVQRKQIANAILLYAFTKLLRSGIYFNPEEFFFILLYAVNGSPRFAQARKVLHRANDAGVPATTALLPAQ